MNKSERLKLQGDSAIPGKRRHGTLLSFTSWSSPSGSHGNCQRKKPPPAVGGEKESFGTEHPILLNKVCSQEALLNKKPSLLGLYQSLTGVEDKQIPNFGCLQSPTWWKGSNLLQSTLATLLGNTHEVHSLEA